MSEHSATISWSHVPHEGEPETYSRNHTSALKGGQLLNVSAAVAYKGDADCTDPEQMLVSAVASCHMLVFLAIAEAKGLHVESYEDAAVGTLEKNAEGRMAITHITLRPRISFSGDKTPDADALDKIHAGAHRNCFIANSIKAEVTVETPGNE